MITLKQFTGRTMTPTDDAALYDFFSSKQSGIIDGCQVTSLGDNRLQVSAGRGIIRGRSFVVEQEEIRAQLGTAENQKGRLSIKIDLGNTGTPISFVTAAGETLDNPIQQDINHGGSVFELPLAEYTVGATQITNLKNVAIQLIMASPVSMEMGEYSGTGTTSRTIELGYKPTLVRIFTVGEPPILAISTLGETQVYSAIATQAGASKGLSLTDTGFKVLQSGSSTPDGKKNMLNQSGKRYIYLTIRQGGVTDSPIIPERPTEEIYELKDIPVGAKIKIPEFTGFEESLFVVVAQNHVTHPQNSVCLMLNKPYKTELGYPDSNKNYAINALKRDIDKQVEKMPDPLKEALMTVTVKHEGYNVNDGSLELNQLQCKLFPPSGYEVFGDLKNSDGAPTFPLERESRNCERFEAFSRKISVCKETYFLRSTGIMSKQPKPLTAAEDSTKLYYNDSSVSSGFVFCFVLPNTMQCKIASNSDTYTLLI